MLRSLTVITLLAFVALPLSACGLRGELVRPAPAWGDPPLEGPNDPRVLKEKADKQRAEKDAKAGQREKEAAEPSAAAVSPTPAPTTASK